METLTVRLARRSSSRRQAVKDALSVAGLVTGMFWIWTLLHWTDPFGGDAHGYWDVNVATLYQTAVVGPTGSYMRYGPPVALAFVPLHALPYTVFLTIWTVSLVVVLIWLARDWTLMTLGFLPVVMEIYFGNVDLLIAAAIVVGFRYPASWSFVLLTKVTPGIGLLWFVVRREWRQLALALAATAALAIAAALIAPELWPKWIKLLTATETIEPKAIAIPVLVRLPLAVALVCWGALTDRRWAVPVAVTAALPVLWWEGLSILVAVIPLVRGSGDASPLGTRRRAEAGSTPTAGGHP